MYPPPQTCWRCQMPLTFDNTEPHPRLPDRECHNYSCKACGSLKTIIKRKEDRNG